MQTEGIAEKHLCCNVTRDLLKRKFHKCFLPSVLGSSIEVKNLKYYFARCQRYLDTLLVENVVYSLNTYFLL